MRLKVTKIHREETNSIEIYNIFERGLLGIRTDTIIGHGLWPEIGKSIFVVGDSLTEGMSHREFNTSAVVKITGNMFETQSGSVYRVEEIK